MHIALENLIVNRGQLKNLRIFGCKAIEYRQFMLYTGPIVMHGIVEDDVYLYFLLLHTTLRVFFAIYSKLAICKTSFTVIRGTD